MQYTLRNPPYRKEDPDRSIGNLFCASSPASKPEDLSCFGEANQYHRTKKHHMLQFYQNIWWFLFEVRFYSLVTGYMSLLQRLNLNANSRPPTRIATVTASNIHCPLPCAVPALFSPILGKGA